MPGAQQHLIPFDEGQFPGRLPEAVKLVEPADPGDAKGVVLSCRESRNAVGYQLLLGADPAAVETYQVLADTPEPPVLALETLPFDPAFWTVRVRDAQGSTVHADPRPLSRVGLTWRVENLRSGERSTSIQAAIDVAWEDDEIVVQPGVFHENLSIGTRRLTLRSVDPQDLDLVSRTVITSLGRPRRTVLDIRNVSDVSVLGLSLIGGSHGTRCAKSDVTVENCLVLLNLQGMAIENSSVTLAHCVIADNQGAGVTVSAQGRQRGLTSQLLSCVVANNGSYGIEAVQGLVDLDQCTLLENRGPGVSAGTATLIRSLVYYNGPDASGPQLEGVEIEAIESNIQGGWPGVRNRDEDPGFECLRRLCPTPLFENGRVKLPGHYRR